MPNLPRTLDELWRAGGPRAFIKRAAKEAALGEARFWLAALEKWAEQVDDDDLKGRVWIDGTIRDLRRMVGVKRSPEEARAMTRERVRRHRERKQANKLHVELETKGEL